MRYEPSNIPDIIPPDENGYRILTEYVSTEFRHVANLQVGITPLEMIALTILRSAPRTPFAGIIVYADGTDWDPGSGEGLYRYSLSGSWVKVG